MITLELISVSGLVLSEEVHEVVVPTPKGQIAVFPNHMPLISLVSPGVISVRRQAGDRDDKMEHYATAGGVVEIQDGKVIRVLVDIAEHGGQIAEKEAEAALVRARTLAKESHDLVSLHKAEQLIQTQQARLKVAELRRRHKR